MPVGEVKWMKDFFPGEVDFIINAIKHQRYDKEWSIELNNNFTKFRKCKLIK